MSKLWPIAVLLAVLGAGIAAVVVYAQLSDTQTASGVISAVGAPLTPTPTPTPTTPGKTAFVNEQGQAAGFLHITTTTSFLLPVVVQNAPGCDDPSVAVGLFEYVELTWPSPCVDPGEAVSMTLGCPSEGCFVSTHYFAPAPPAQTFTQPLSLAANGLHVGTGNIEFLRGVAELTANAPGCPSPAVSLTNSGLDIRWSSPCVDQGESVTVRVVTEIKVPDYSFFWLYLDKDGDGCTDEAELQTAPGSERFGGRRDPNNFWDFMDVPAGMPLERDRAVSAADIAAVVQRFGSNASGAGTFDRNSDPLSTPNAVTPNARENYHPAFDRGGSDPEGNVWNLLSPDGAISGGDIAAAVAQFGHSCL